MEYGKKLGRDFTLLSLKDSGFEYVFMGIGMPAPKKDAVFAHVGPEHGSFTSKDFLPLVSKASKGGLASHPPTMPRLHGHAIVLGAGTL